MGTINEIREIPKKYKKYIDEFSELFKKYKITSLSGFIKMYQTDEQFSVESKVILTKISQAEGGKLSLTTIGIIIGTSLGGVGIAMLGTAFGAPLAVLFGLGGFLTGSKIDSSGVLSSMKTVETKISEETYIKLELIANGCNMTASEYLALVIKDYNGLKSQDNLSA